MHPHGSSYGVWTLPVLLNRSGNIPGYSWWRNVWYDRIRWASFWQLSSESYASFLGSPYSSWSSREAPVSPPPPSQLHSSCLLFFSVTNPCLGGAPSPYKSHYWGGWGEVQLPSVNRSVFLPLFHTSSTYLLPFIIMSFKDGGGSGFSAVC